jgi:hypothetical protein
MANVKISQLPSATTPLSGLEEIAIVQNNQTVKTTAESIRGGYKVYTALLTQSGVDDVQTIGSDDIQPLVIGVTYTIQSNVGDADFTNVGASNNDVGTSFVATGTTPNSWGTPGDNVINYDEGAPVVTVLENTIGNVWFIYQNIGTYEVISDALFIADKTTCITSQSASNDTGVTFIYRDNVNLIYIETSDFFTQTPANDILAGTMLEIRVYS